MARKTRNRQCGSEQLVRAAEAAKAQGWTICRGRRTHHFKWVPPDKGKPPVYNAGTPGDRRGNANFVARLRRSGLVL